MTATRFYRPNKDLEDKPLHYKDCGLDNIFLMNGFETETHDGDEYVTIKDMDGLHRAIGLHIIMSRKAPSGREVRFLRNEMDLSQAELGNTLGVTDQSVARWEKGQTEVPGPAVFALKVLYLISLVPEGKREGVISQFMEALRRLSETDETTDHATFTYRNGQWLDRAA